MVPYDASDHFEQMFLLYFDAGGRSLLIGDRLENCWLATSNSCNTQFQTTISEEIMLKTVKTPKMLLVKATLEYFKFPSSILMHGLFIKWSI